MTAFGENPFAALTLIAAPAILTNASSVLALGTSNRFARAVDRQRQLTAMLEGPPADEQTCTLRVGQLDFAQRRAALLLRALTGFYLAVGAFACAALISLLGAAVISMQNGYLDAAARLAALVTGFVGIFGLVLGCSLLVRETRMALHSLRDETAFTRERHDARRNGAAALAPPRQESPVL